MHGATTLYGHPDMDAYLSHTMHFRMDSLSQPFLKPKCYFALLCRIKTIHDKGTDSQ
jgi:hypothetical protein